MTVRFSIYSTVTLDTGTKVTAKDYHLEYPKNKSHFLENFRKCLKNSSEYIVLPLGIRFSNGEGGHFNIILVDKKQKTVERFEPYGVETLEDFKIMAEFDRILKNEFKKFGLSYLSANMLCPDEGIQLIEEKQVAQGIKTAVNLKSDPIGYCIAWSIYYVDMRLSNPGINPKILIKKIILELKTHKHSYRTFIRNYSSFLKKEKRKFLKSLNVIFENTNGFGDQNKFSNKIDKKLTEYFLKKIN